MFWTIVGALRDFVIHWFEHSVLCMVICGVVTLFGLFIVDGINKSHTGILHDIGAMICAFGGIVGALSFYITLYRLPVLTKRCIKHIKTFIQKDKK